MTFEIERRFLIKQYPLDRDPIKTEHIVQGYLSVEPEKTIRIRLISGMNATEDRAFLTIKGKSDGPKRVEIETPIDYKTGHDFLVYFRRGNLIQKIRTTYQFGDLFWEIDKFAPPHYGLVIAEVELKSVDQVIDIPNWVGKEITDDYRYSNSNLAMSDKFDY